MLVRISFCVGCLVFILFCEVSILSGLIIFLMQEHEMTMYEGLQIMRRGRFEDQRGTEICFEIPEFLRKPKEEDPNKPESF